ncbi:hypothetical protein HMPREF9455_03073 [Dysgonomonas gadei ATCC BAA-286]|uniref:Uncharacterized protein n=1 Tax=Dysgonomonas gadei ATCC BAA-286 TaxID=742766 RepID=F5J156_9BACT|nr:hypothetical protein HMPREF9455_03073 [Dysgonomonas gadei ATCC BAA-286]
MIKHFMKESLLILKYLFPLFIISIGIIIYVHNYKNKEYTENTL